MCGGHGQGFFTEPRILFLNILLGVCGGASLRVILTEGEEGGSSVRGGALIPRDYLQGWECSLSERPSSPAQRRLRGSGCDGRPHLFRRPATQFPRFLHYLHDSAAVAPSRSLFKYGARL